MQLVVWNAQQYIPHIFDSLRKQTYTDWKLFVFVNQSDDQTAELVKQELQNVSFEYAYFAETQNLGFAGGHNRLFGCCDSPYVLFLNVDLLLEPDCFANLVEFLENNPNVGSISPRIMYWNFLEFSLGKISLQQSKTSRVDSLGLKMFGNRRVVEQYRHKDWSDVRRHLGDTIVQVFGVSGTLPAFSRSVLKKVQFPDGTVFDNSYGSYKEDVDLAFRLNGHGYESFVLLDTIVYHNRYAAGAGTFTDLAASQNKKNQSEKVMYESYRNHLATLYKNESLSTLGWHIFFVLWYEIKKFGWFLLLKPRILKGWYDLWSLREDLYRKRQFVQQTRTVTAREYRNRLQVKHKTIPLYRTCDLHIVVSNYMFGNALQTLFTSLYKDLEKASFRYTLTVVDNSHNRDGIHDILMQHFPEITYIDLNKNLGCGKSHNVGFFSHPARYYFALNGDTVIPDGGKVMEKMLQFMDTHPKVGAAGPKMLYPDGKLQDSCFRFDMDSLVVKPFRQLHWHHKYKSVAQRTKSLLMHDFDHNHTQPVDWVLGAAMIIRREAILDCGWFDDRYFMYLEDCDWCRRMWEKGWAVYYVHDVALQHTYARSSSHVAGTLNALIKNRYARHHLVSWMKYMWRWHKNKL